MTLFEIKKINFSDPSDLEAYGRFINHLKASMNDGPKWLAEEIPVWQHVYLGVFKQEEVAGLWFRKFDDIFEIDYISSRSNFQRQGFAKKLMEHLIQLGKSQKIKQIWLEVEKQNISAVRFYEHAGFKPAHTRPDYYGKGRDGVNYSLELL